MTYLHSCHSKRKDPEDAKQLYFLGSTGNTIYCREEYTFSTIIISTKISRNILFVLFVTYFHIYAALLAYLHSIIFQRVYFSNALDVFYGFFLQPLLQATFERAILNTKYACECIFECCLTQGITITVSAQHA